MRAALYARVSTEDQIDGYSIEGQLATTRGYAVDRTWDVVEEYIDAGFSARTDNRPAFKRMIADAKQHNFDMVLVLRSDRFARNRMHASMYKQLLREVGVKVISVTEPIEDGTPAAVILEGMNEVIAEWYSVDLSVKVTDAKKRRAEKGLWNGPVPFGYAKTSDGTLGIVQDECEIIRRVFEMYGSGQHTFQSIANWLNQTDFRPRVHRRDRKGRNYLWSKDTAADMLRNPFYLGYVKYKSELLPGKHSPIVTQELFDSVQATRRQHYKGPATFAQRYRTYLLKGLLRCVHCGEKLWAQHISGHDYYREENSLRGIPCPNGKAYLRAEVFDDPISRMIGELQLPSSWRELVLDLLDAEDNWMDAAKERRRLDQKLDRIKFQFREGHIGQPQYQEEMALTQASLAAVQEPEEAKLISLGDHVEGLVQAWPLATKAEQHQLLTMMLDSVYVDMKGERIVGVKPKVEFLPLFNLREPVKAGEWNLVSGDPDGIRTHDLRRDRPIC